MSWIIFEVWKVSHKALSMNIGFNKNYLFQISQRPNHAEECFTRTTICIYFPVFIFFTFLKHPNISSPVIKFSYTRVNMKTVLHSLLYIEIHTRHMQKVLLYGGIWGEQLNIKVNQISFVIQVHLSGVAYILENWKIHNS